MSVEHDLEKWVPFLVGLELASTSENEDLLTGFQWRFRSEIAQVTAWLEELKITGGQRHIAIDAPSQCDCCGANLINDGLYVDGEMQGGSWGNICMSCFAQNGRGIGWGVGQLYQHKADLPDGNPLWVCIAGGNPENDFEVSASD